MRGLLIKDFYSLWQSKSSYVYIFALSIMFTMLFKDNGHYFITMFSMLFMLMINSTFHFDETVKWSGYAATFPKGKKGVVLGKYVFSLLCILTCILLSFFVSFVVNIFFSPIFPLENIINSFTTSIIYLFTLSFVLPLIFKFGILKIRYISALALVLPYIVLGVIPFSFNFNIATIIFDSPNALYLAGCISCIVYIISLFVSQHIYSKKDL